MCLGVAVVSQIEWDLELERERERKILLLTQPESGNILPRVELVRFVSHDDRARGEGPGGDSRRSNGQDGRPESQQRASKWWFTTCEQQLEQKESLVMYCT
jgi:hypothetical protein